MDKYTRDSVVLINPEQALKIVLRNVRPLKAVHVDLDKALHCILAEDVSSDRDQPPKDRSAMDGYAVKAADLGHTPRRLKLIGEVAAGSAAAPRIRPGTCATILTGANLPPGADAVVPVEKTELSDSEVMFRASIRRGGNVRKRGEEARRGKILLRPGTRLSPPEIGVCATVGKARVKVYPWPGVAVLCTGEEIRDVKERVKPHQLRDSNGPVILAALEQHGIGGVRRRIVPDNPKVIASRLKRLLATHQVVILTGGVSVGKYDYVAEAVKQAGGAIQFHGVRMKPGKPQLYASFKGNRHVFGLPGNPLSVLAGLFELVLPGLRRMAGVPAKLCSPRVMVELAKQVSSKGERVYFCLARLVNSNKGLSAIPVSAAGSADLIAVGRADGVIKIAVGVKRVQAGTLVEFHPWKQIL